MCEKLYIKTEILSVINTMKGVEFWFRNCVNGYIATDIW
jgi:hypothetical protein